MPCGFETAKALIGSRERPALELNQRLRVLLRDDVIEFIGGNIVPEAERTP